MTEKEYQAIMDLAQRMLQEMHTPEEALRRLQSAGIFDENGNYTEPYKELEKITGQTGK